MIYQVVLVKTRLYEILNMYGGHLGFSRHFGFSEIGPMLIFLYIAQSLFVPSLVLFPFSEVFFFTN
jgi:hypothetical protein